MSDEQIQLATISCPIRMLQDNSSTTIDPQYLTTLKDLTDADVSATYDTTNYVSSEKMWTFNFGSVNDYTALNSGYTTWICNNCNTYTRRASYPGAYLTSQTLYGQTTYPPTSASYGTAVPHRAEARTWTTTQQCPDCGGFQEFSNTETLNYYTLENGTTAYTRGINRYTSNVKIEY